MEKCSVCDVEGTHKCSGCNGKYYCSRDHQKIDWKNHKNECKCYEIASNNVLGRYMIAKRDIRAGEIIFREHPCVLGPKIASHVICLGCHKTINPPMCGDYYKCSKCNWPMCGKNCETLPWHVDECRVMHEKMFKSPIRNTGEVKIESSYCVIVPLRIMLLQHKNPKNYKAIMELVSHLDQRLQTKLYGALRVNLVPFFKDFLKFQSCTENDILNIAGILDTNCFDIILPSKQIRARGIYPLTAMMAHECVPNTKHFVDGNLEMKVIACTSIKKGEMILTSYTHPLKTTIERRHQLKEAKCFDCLCPRCSDSSEMGTFASGVKCLKCSIGIVISIAPLDNLSDWQCNICLHKFTALDVLNILNRARRSLESLNKKSINECEKFLLNFETFLPSSNVIVIDVKYALCLLYGNATGYETKDLTERQLIRKAELCEQTIDALNKLEPGISNSITNVKFEMSTVKIAQIKRKTASNVLSKVDADKLIECEMKNCRDQYEFLMAGSEGRSQLESRLKRLNEL